MARILLVVKSKEKISNKAEGKKSKKKKKWFLCSELDYVTLGLSCGKLAWYSRRQVQCNRRVVSSSSFHFHNSRYLISSVIPGRERYCENVTQVFGHLTKKERYTRTFHKHLGGVWGLSRGFYHVLLARPGFRAESLCAWSVMRVLHCRVRDHDVT